MTKHIICTQEFTFKRRFETKEQEKIGHISSPRELREQRKRRQSAADVVVEVVRILHISKQRDEF